MWWTIVLSIYIPLCFYLYSRHRPFLHPDLPDLHSTMFLLIRKQGSKGMTLDIIYIPLCFYLYRLCKRVTWPRKDLHSTMFLLILYEILKNIVPNSFTFHYVSTYTLEIIQLLHILLIYIPLCFYLYRIPSICSNKSSLNLHSTMFLLIPGKAIAWGRDFIEFTFHYVSTYT